MAVLEGKKIILAITGSIAAYKSALLCRLLIRQGAEVRIVMTSAATGMISQLTMSTLSRHPVMTSVHSGDTWHNHVELGLWADMMLVAPATANTLAHMAHGLCDSAVDAVYLSAKCPVMVAPAMDLDMWDHPATQNNMHTLRSHGVIEIPVGTGELASGLTGPGRMAEPEEIVNRLEEYFQARQTHSADLAGVNVLVTAGPTHEKLDPVRFIGNNSSGKMGIALATAFAERKAKVTLVLGPGSATPPQHELIEVQRVESAQEMFNAAQAGFAQAQITVFAAAVADYKPAVIADQKIKKKDDDLTIQLVKTIDIAGTLGAVKRKDQLIAGFALETQNELANAQDKLKRKHMDLIVLNSLNDPGAGFAVDTNQVTLIGPQGIIMRSGLLPKQEIATIIVDELVKLSNSK